MFDIHDVKRDKPSAAIARALRPPRRRKDRFSAGRCGRGQERHREGERQRGRRRGEGQKEENKGIMHITDHVLFVEAGRGARKRIVDMQRPAEAKDAGWL
jgi:hypothetical protein